jgi:archaellum biogenesis ATPase FlaH
MKPKFLKPEHDIDLNAVDYWNIYHTWQECFDGIKNVEWINDKTIVNHKSGKESFAIKADMLFVTGNNELGLPVDKKYTKFMLLSRIKFKQNHRACITWIEHKFLHAHIPYIRVGTDYFKIINKTDRYGVTRKVIKGWKKEEIKQDHTQSLLKIIPAFDDFIIEPDNSKFEQVIDSCYNLYAPFSHKPSDQESNESQIPVSVSLLKHIFGNQYKMGLQYIKLLYQKPKQPLPILCLVSRERQTGKTTFLNWMQIMFGDNFTQINPEDLNSQFNSIYATKNIIALDETVIDKSHAVEKLKSIATAKTISVNQKFVANYSIPFYGKVIICTNKEKDFMRIDEEEIRFWIRKVPVIDSINTNIENDLRNEIPAFLHYLSQIEMPNLRRSRMVFTADELKNDQLDDIQKESWSWLRKEIFINMEAFFDENAHLNEVKCTVLDIKNRFFSHNNQVTVGYLMKILKDEIQLKQEKPQRYSPFDGDETTKRVGRVFTMKRSDFQKDILEKVQFEEIPF